jgi:hypothetical protein
MREGAGKQTCNRQGAGDHIMVLERISKMGSDWSA